MLQPQFFGHPAQQYSFMAVNIFPYCGRGRRISGWGWERGWGWGCSQNEPQFNQKFPTTQKTQQNQQAHLFQQQQASPNTTQAFHLQSYCWTHRETFNPTHTLQTCQNPAPGHYPNATITNTMNKKFYRLPCWPTTSINQSKFHYQINQEIKRT